MMLMSSLGGHDLNVLERTVCRSIVSVTAGNAYAMTHDHRRGGQLCQTLVHAVNGQLIWKIQTEHSIRCNKSHSQTRKNETKQFTRPQTLNQRIKGHIKVGYRDLRGCSVRAQNPAAYKKSSAMSHQTSRRSSDLKSCSACMTGCCEPETLRSDTPACTRCMS